ncbi:Mrx19 protein [Saccharomycopsis crataegensis]|uniref:Mrx19 protein n=1 Tax=Saccharomycopsis crataegensis TaxID=43959 RepID=A0AAV5QKY8_9ASCO|nr:Mrx19 protein [Saccharomycopsis crataegensis]
MLVSSSNSYGLPLFIRSRGLSLFRISIRANSSAPNVAVPGGSVKSLAPMNMIVLPVTTKKKFIFYNYHRSFDWNTYLELQAKDVTGKSFGEKLQIKSQLNLLKVTKKMQTVWENMSTSNNKVMKYSYDTVQRFLKRINWFETCLSSIPSRSTVLREIRTEIKNNEFLETVDLSHVKQKHQDRMDFFQSSFKEHNSTDRKDTIAHEDDFLVNKEVYATLLKPIPLYYPKSLLSEADIVKFINEDIQGNYYKHHMRSMIYCILGLPLTIPFVILPVIPNIPGFYLCYRIYCHWKVMSGLKHLNYLMNDPLPTNGESQGHFQFANLPQLDQIYSTHYKELPSMDNHHEEEKLLINEKIIDEIIDVTGLDHISMALHNSLSQERKRLDKS